ncbi:MAG: T9SS type A sorting domain-containing protein [Candidatus Eisenbacteria bacterium]|nr:T9SS type A sorting domain-containing protein [Candidatus Eisenbacteria bacterium]
MGTGALDINYSLYPRLWSLPLADGGQWSEIVISGTSPLARMLASAVFDPESDRIILFSGYSTGSPDTWELTRGIQNVWTRLVPLGAPPSYRWSSTVAYRALQPAMYMFGGHNGGNFTDTWALRLGTSDGPVALESFSPVGGRPGTAVSVFGAHLDLVTEVRFNGVPSIVQNATYGVFNTVVPPGATTGRIQVTSSRGIVTSTTDFFVGEDPVLTSLEPDSARAGEVIALRGSHLLGTRRVLLGGVVVGTFSVSSDSLILITVDALSRSGRVTVETPVATVISGFDFHLIADDMRPRLLSVRDVPGDQGGKVVLRWRSSDFDQARYRRVKGYRVWRRAPLAGAPGAVRAGTLDARGAALGDPDVFWESLVDLPAASLRGYAYTAATVSDSTANGNPYTAFFVQTLTDDAFEFFASSPDSGYSVDDLAPPTPSQLSVRYSSTSNQLRWTARMVPDQAGFEIHRATRTDFTPDATTLVSRVQDSTFVDTPGAFTYKLAAVDIHGNRSRFLTVVPDRPVATLVSVASQDRRPGAIEIRWYLSGNAALAAVVERRSSGQDWRARASLSADGSGYLRFVDDGIPDDESFEYRLRIEEPEGPVWLGQVTFEPLGTVTGPTVRIPNPSMGGRIAFELAGFDTHPVQVQLFDVTGRLMESRRLESGAGAPAQVAFGQARRLHAGIYLVRVSGAASVITRRVVVLD